MGCQKKIEKEKERDEWKKTRLQDGAEEQSTKGKGQKVEKNCQEH